MTKDRELNPRYNNEILAWEYDRRQPLPFPGELEWYLKYASRSGSPLLELACGSGRLLIPIAQSGYTIDGVDNSEAMLNRLKSKLKSLDENTRQKIRLFCQDMTEFHTGRQYAMVTIAYNSLQYLETKDRILRCLQRVHNSLKKDGYFLLLVRRLDISSFAQGKVIVFDWMNKPVVNEELELSVGSRLVSYLDTKRSGIINERTYKIMRENGTPETIDFIDYTPIINTYEYVEMLERTGFTVRVSSGYDERPEDGISKEVGFVCRKTDRIS
jgi:SAM-dependent methyltransferase